jgi:asparagine synthase (glutamine-hydrolysing)
MCGISGIFDLRTRRRIDPRRLQRMSETLIHRGPDGSGTHLEEGLGLAHRRLAILDIAGGAQPMTNENGHVVTVYNGEIYNFSDLRRDLERRGHQFRTRSDTEVIVHAWEEFGGRCVEQFRGMFAFALWDRDRDTLFLARDRLGEKPLYYTMTPQGLLLFASEVQAIVAGLAAVPALDPEAVADYLTYGYVPDPKSIFAGIRKLPPAHFLEVRRGLASPPLPQRYWRVEFHPQHSGDDEGLAAALRERLRASVEMRMIADVPLGAFLSGGVDSSGIVALMSQASAVPVRTCCIGFDDRRYDETIYARTLAQRYGTDHSSERVDVDACGLIDRMAAIYGEPFADVSALPTSILCGLTRRHVKVALSGDGGDEVFAGYRRYAFHVREERVRRLVPASIRRALLGPLAACYPKLDWAPRGLRAKATLEALASDAIGGYLRALTLLPAAQLQRLLNADFRAALNGYQPVSVLARHAAAANTDDPLSRAQFIDLQTWLPGRMLVKVDRASMASSLEVRPPLLDHRLVEWAARLPPHFRLRGGGGKYLLKKALEPWVPHDLLYRPKQGFTPPLARWLRGALANRLDDLPRRSALAGSGLIDARYLAGLIAAHQKGLRDHSQILWALIMFDAFLRRSWMGVSTTPSSQAA